MPAKARLIQEQSSNDTHHSEANDLSEALSYAMSRRVLFRGGLVIPLMFPKVNPNVPKRNP